jgi:pimeloyl-ACP methyl ester carboxylesterase
MMAKAASKRIFPGIGRSNSRMSQLPISANLKNNKGDRQSRNERHTFVLVHGGWCGGWIWRYVAPALRERGHVATTPTLTGLGERRHSGNRTATLSTHIEDIVAHIEMDGFEDVILVSQSYGAGWPPARWPVGRRPIIEVRARKGLTLKEH